MKKITAAILLTLTLLALTACGAADTAIGSAMVVSMSGANAGEKDGKTQADVTSCTVELDGDKIVSVQWDVVQCKATVTAKGEVTVAQSVISKKDLKEGYNMKPASPIGKEWYEQTAAFCAFITGKTLNEAIAVAANPAETDVIASCTIGTEDFLKLIVKAGL